MSTLRVAAALGCLVFPAAACVEPSFVGSEPDAATTRPKDAGTADRTMAPASRPDAAPKPIADAQVEADAAVVEAVVPPGTCDPAGTHVLTLNASVDWDPASINLLGAPVETVNGGRGYVQIAALSKVEHDGSRYKGTVRPCWGVVPDFMAFGMKYGAAIPDSTWDNLDRSWTVGLNYPCTRPDCQVESGFLTAQLGLNIPDTATWPQSADSIDAGITTDDDGDGLPGVLVRLRGPDDPGGYSYVPTASLEPVSELMIALRVGADLFGTVQTCDVYSGESRVANLALTTLGCRIAGSGRLCTADEVNFVNANFPKWRISKMLWQSERVSDDATCADVRALQK